MNTEKHFTDIIIVAKRPAVVKAFELFCDGFFDSFSFHKETNYIINYSTFWVRINFFFGGSNIFLTILSKRLDKYIQYNYNIIMEEINFEWDENKNTINKNKHKISFEEAKTVFYDEQALIIDDPEHSAEEERFIILGFSSEANLLVVCHCYRSADLVIRIISARKATKNEAKYYEKRGN